MPGLRESRHLGLRQLDVDASLVLAEGRAMQVSISAVSWTGSA